MAKKLVSANPYCGQSDTELLTDDVGTAVASEFYCNAQPTKCRSYIAAVPAEREVNAIDHMQLAR